MPPDSSAFDSAFKILKLDRFDKVRFIVQIVDIATDEKISSFLAWQWAKVLL